MSLRTRLILVLALIAVLPLVLFGYTAYTVSTTNLLSVERENLGSALKSINFAISNLESAQNKTLNDWANYDDLHTQIAQGTPDPTFITTNFDPTVANSVGSTYKLDIIGLWSDGLIPLYSYGPSGDAARNLSAIIHRAVLQDMPVTQITLIGQDVYIVSIAAVRTSAAVDPNGILMFGVKIGPAAISQIKNLTGYDVALYRNFQPITSVQATTLTPNPEALKAAAAGQQYFQQNDANTALALEPLQDFAGNNIASVVVSRPRTTTTEAQNSITSTLAVFFILGLLLALIVGGIATQTIVPPLMTIVAAANEFAGGDLHRRVTLKRRDELGTLANAFNSMANRITERVQTTEGEKVRLQEIDVYRLNLLTEIAQALRVPLSTIQNNAGTLGQAQYGTLNQPQERLIDGIRRAAVQEETLLADLVDYSRAQRKQLQIMRERLSMGDLIHEAAAAVKERYKAKPIRFSSVIPTDLPTIMADRVRMEQVLDTLLTWAYDYSVIGGEVKVNAALQEQDIAISVSDSSKGLSGEEQGKIFDLFYHPDGNGHATNGLGLAFVKALIEQQGGTIRVDSDSGHGNIFTFTLPA